MDFLTYCHMFLLSSLFRCHSLHNKKYKFRHECSGVVELFHSHISFGARKIHWILLVFLSASSSFSYFVGDVALGHQLWQPPPPALDLLLPENSSLNQLDQAWVDHQFALCFCALWSNSNPAPSHSRSVTSVTPRRVTLVAAEGLLN